ncbi:MAG: NYN domain-containing protein [Synechococcaceae cyanobacterium]
MVEESCGLVMASARMTEKEMDKKFAVFIDGDNIAPQYPDSIFAEISKDGELLVKRIYDDWTTTNMGSWKVNVFVTPVRIFLQFRFGPNATDNSIIMDAIELCNQSNDINAICIVSTDADYYSLALRLREIGKFVLGIGKENSKPIWQNACNQFVFLENLNRVSLPQQNDHSLATQESSLPELGKLLDFAIDNSKSDNDGWVSLSDLGKSIRSRYPGFDPRSYNHKNLLQLVGALSDDIEIRADENQPPNYWARSIKKIKSEEVASTGIVKRFMGVFGFIENEKGSYFFTLSNILPTSRDKKFKKGTKVRFSVFKEPNPLGEDNADKNGKASNVEIIED